MIDLQTENEIFLEELVTDTEQFASELYTLAGTDEDQELVRLGYTVELLLPNTLIARRNGEVILTRICESFSSIKNQS